MRDPPKQAIHRSRSQIHASPEHSLPLYTMSDKTQMTKEAAARVQSTEARGNAGKQEAGNFAARAQAAAAKNTGQSGNPAAKK